MLAHIVGSAHKGGANDHKFFRYRDDVVGRRFGIVCIRGVAQTALKRFGIQDVRPLPLSGNNAHRARAECPLFAQSGHRTYADECPLLEAKRTAGFSHNCRKQNAVLTSAPELPVALRLIAESNFKMGAVATCGDRIFARASSPRSTPEFCTGPGRRGGRLMTRRRRAR